MRITRLAVAAALVGAGYALAGCGGDEVTVPTVRTGRTVVDSVQVGDTTRTYRLFIPVVVENTAEDLPLVIAFHDKSESGGSFQILTGFDEFADDFDFFVAYPDAIAPDWAAGCNCTAADTLGVNDTAFVRLLISTIDDEYQIDRDRIYAAGYSLGGVFAHSLACGMSDEFAAVSSVAGPMPLILSQSCNPTLPVAVLGIQGTEDATFPWDGGGTGTAAVLGASETIDLWADINNCPDTAEVSHPTDNFDDGTTLSVWRYRPCDGDTESILIGVDGGVHGWWTSSEMNTTLTIAGFLLAFQR